MWPVDVPVLIVSPHFLQVYFLGSPLVFFLHREFRGTLQGPGAIPASFLRSPSHSSFGICPGAWGQYRFPRNWVWPGVDHNTFPHCLHLCGSGVFLRHFFRGLFFTSDLGLFLLLRDRTTNSESDSSKGEYSGGDCGV